MASAPTNIGRIDPVNYLQPGQLLNFVVLRIATTLNATGGAADAAVAFGTDASGFTNQLGVNPNFDQATCTYTCPVGGDGLYLVGARVSADVAHLRTIYIVGSNTPNVSQGSGTGGGVVETLSSSGICQLLANQTVIWQIATDGTQIVGAPGVPAGNCIWLVKL